MAYPDNTARCVFEFTLPNGTPGFVTPHVRSFDGSDLSAADVENIAVLLADWATAQDFEGETNDRLMLIPTDQLTLSTITVTSLKAVGPPQHVESVGVAGAQVGTPLPNEAALVVTLYTGIVGRRFRGRNYWPILASAYMEDNGTLNNATVATIQDTFNALIAGLENDGRYLLAVNSEAGGFVNQVTSCVVRDTVHHQRRRNQ